MAAEFVGSAREFVPRMRAVYKAGLEQHFPAAVARVVAAYATAEPSFRGHCTGNAALNLREALPEYFSPRGLVVVQAGAVVDAGQSVGVWPAAAVRGETATPVRYYWAGHTVTDLIRLADGRVLAHGDGVLSVWAFDPRGDCGFRHRMWIVNGQLAHDNVVAVAADLVPRRRADETDAPPWHGAPAMHTFRQVCVVPGGDTQRAIIDPGSHHWPQATTVHTVDLDWARVVMTQIVPLSRVLRVFVAATRGVAAIYGENGGAGRHAVMQMPISGLVRHACMEFTEVPFSGGSIVVGMVGSGGMTTTPPLPPPSSVAGLIVSPHGGAIMCDFAHEDRCQLTAGLTLYPDCDGYWRLGDGRVVSQKRALGAAGGPPAIIAGVRAQDGATTGSDEAALAGPETVVAIHGASPYLETVSVWHAPLAVDFALGGPHCQVRVPGGACRAVADYDGGVVLQSYNGDLVRFE